MDNVDKKIKEILNSKMDIPDHFDKAIKEALYTKEGRQAVLEYKTYLFNKKKRLKRIATTAIASISTLSTICVAGYAYDRVWYEPETYSYEYIQQELNAGVSEEVKNTLISEDEAKEIAIGIVTKLGYENVEVSSIKLSNDISGNSEGYYTIEVSSDNSHNLNIYIDGESGEINSLRDENLKNLLTNYDDISTAEAVEYADTLMKNFDYTSEDYKLSKCEQETFYIEGKQFNLWNVSYNKVYNGIYNPYEIISLDFIVSNKIVYVYQFRRDVSGKFENNYINISQKDAIDIACAKEKEFTDKEISEIDVELGIMKMNPYIYMLENNIDFSNNISNHLYSQNISRKVWIVTIKHKQDKIITFDNNISLFKNRNKAFYIDCSNGEIIGGCRV